MANLAIIPARSGSKGIINKNIVNLKGKPLMAYSIEAAVNSELFDVVHVSTDSLEYAEIAKEYGADVPFLRSDELSGDKASSWDVVIEVLHRYEELGMRFESVALLQPTSPLRTSTDIVSAYKMFYEKNAQYIISACETDFCPLCCNTLPDDKSLVGFAKREVSDVPRQSLPKYYRINGAIYILRVDGMNLPYGIYEDNSYAYIMSQKKSIDIDSEKDLLLAGYYLDKE